MAGLVLLALVVLTLALAAGAAVLALAVSRAGRSSSSHAEPPIGDPAALPAAVRHAQRTAAVAWLALVVGGALAAAAAASLDGLRAGVLVGLVPGLAGVAFLTTHVAGEARWPRPHGPVRAATLAPRHPEQMVPPALAGWTAALGLGTAALLAVGGATAGPSQREFTRAWPLGSAGAGPYPGWSYGVPLLLAVVVVGVLAALALRAVLARPAVAGADEQTDLLLRSASIRQVLAGTQLVLGATFAGVLFFAANAWRSVGTAADDTSLTSWRLAGGVGLLVAVVVGLACLVVAVLAGSRAAALIRSVPVLR